MTRRLLACSLVCGALSSALPARAAPPIKGMALGLYDPEGKVYPEMLREIRTLGADTVSLVVSWKQHDVRSDLLAPDAQVTLPDDRLRQVIRAAHKQGLKVFLFPIVEVEIRRPLEWRGTIKPNSVETWWSNYQSFILHYATLAAEEKAEIYSVGSELVSTEEWRDKWYALIAAVRKIYRGTLLYSANWDHYEPVTFWERLDMIGVTAYNELTTNPDAAEDELAQAWTGIRAKLATFAHAAGKPLVVTEVGYTSQDGSAVHPWDYTSRAGLDLEEQRRCYAAFVTAWGREPSLAGVFFWQWWGSGGLKDKNYTPRGKPAERVLRRWYGARDAR